MAYHNPTDLDVALQIAAQRGGQVIAGGTDVYPSAQQGIEPAHFLDVTQVDGLTGISETSDGFRIGAATTWSQILGAKLPPAFETLKQAAREVGSVQIQNAGTIAGNLCNASPAADGMPPLLTLDARVEVASAARGKRILSLAEFITGVRQTALAGDELVTALIVPPPPERAHSAFEKLGSRRYLVISIVMTSAVISCDASGRIENARVAVGAASPVAQRLPGLERDLQGQHPQEIEITKQHLAPLTPINDVRGSGAYRLDAIAEQCVRAIQRAATHE
ncbi:MULTISPECIES: xanthine dehydrogenase family protein subunit M [unclassified Roseovarius]|uniref:FAD binding domain-containing protein n=1 Tax=unclassified Roseovarius TaxID=2614913 RepID=UPI00273F276F|nr:MULTISPECIES: FAD binding domain-containing protein [unclassified Roseovarius]